MQGIQNKWPHFAALAAVGGERQIGQEGSSDTGITYILLKDISPWLPSVPPAPTLRQGQDQPDALFHQNQTS
jgi:hypothetical protein